MSDSSSSKLSSEYALSFESRPLKFDRMGNFLSRYWHEVFSKNKLLGQREFYSIADKQRSQWDACINSEFIKILQDSKPAAEPVVALMRLYCMANSLSTPLTDVAEINVWRAYRMYMGEAVNSNTSTNQLEAAIAAVALTLDGKQVHLVYADNISLSLAREQFSSFFNLLNIDTGRVDADTSASGRQRQYQFKICFCLAQELVFDYLRDRLQIGTMTQGLRLQAEVLYREVPRIQGLTLCGLTVALIADMDKVLMDAARAPLEITGAIENNENEKITLARLGYPGFFRRYEQLSGYGYLSEFKSELWEIYGLVLLVMQKQTALSTNTLNNIYYYQHEEDKWAALLKKVLQYHDAGKTVYLSVEIQSTLEKIQSILKQAEISYSINRANAVEQSASSSAATAVYLQLSDNIQPIPHDGILIFVEYTRARRRTRMMSHFISSTNSTERLLFISPNDKGLSIIIAESLRLQMLVRILKTALNTDTQIGNALRHQLTSIADKVGEQMQTKIRRRLLQQEIQKGKKLSFAGRGE